MATKTARVVQAAHGRPVAEFGLRRAQGPDGGVAVARASYVAGCASTSNVSRVVAMVFPSPVRTLIAGSCADPNRVGGVPRIRQELAQELHPAVDTYDVREGVEDAITVAREMEAEGERLSGIRIDSGDLAKLSAYARRRFDEEGLGYVKIVVSNDPTSTPSLPVGPGRPGRCVRRGHQVGDLLRPASAWLRVQALGAPRRHIGSLWTPVMKFSEQPYKRTIPGVQQVRRYMDTAGAPVCV